MKPLARSGWVLLFAAAMASSASAKEVTWSELNDLASLYKALGRYADADPLSRRALAVYEKAFGQDHPQVATSLNNMAEIYRAQGNYVEAEPLYKRSLDIIERKLGKENPNCAT